jgi:3-hydroxymyristoyl/3-hydroxydecanoyl-(acyl carrier protein) dehydratase
LNPPGERVSRLEVRARTRRKDGELEVHELDMRVPGSLCWFEGHFIGYPILAALVQVQEVLAHASEIWHDVGTPTEIRGAKFKQPIHPADELVLRLSRRETRRMIEFQFSRAGKVCSCGTLKFDPGGGSGT